MNTLIKSPSRLVNLLRADLAGVTPGVGSDMVANAPRVVPTVAALRALQSPVPAVNRYYSAQVTRYAAAVGSGGGSVYWWDKDCADADNGGSIIRPDDAGGNGRWRKTQQKWVTLEDFGGLADGNDESEQMARAIASLGGKGGMIRAHQGRHVFEQGFALPSFTSIVGSGWDLRDGGVEQQGGTQLVIATDNIMAGESLIDLSGTTCATLSRLSILVADEAPDNVSNTAIGIAANTCYLPSFTQVRMAYFGGGAIRLSAARVAQIERCRINWCKQDFIYLDDAADCFIAFNDIGAYVQQDGSDPAQHWAAIRFYGGSHTTFIGNHLYNMGHGWLGDNVANRIRAIGNRCEKNSYSGFKMMGGCHGWQVMDTHSFNNGYAVPSTVNPMGIGGQLENTRDMLFMGNRYENNPFAPGAGWQGRGLQVSTTNGAQFIGERVVDAGAEGIVADKSNDLDFQGCVIYGAKKQGFVAQDSSGANEGSNDLTYDNCRVYKVGQAADNLYDGYWIRQGSSRIDIRGGKVRHGGGAVRSRWGVNVADADCLDVRVIDVDLRNSGTAGAFNTAGTTETRGCAGLLTRNAGTATVISGNTTTVVNHGLARTPAVKDIRVTPINNLGNASKFWISGVSSAQFTINVDSNPGATTATFSWQADTIGL